MRTVFLATSSERRRMVNPRKVYPIDPGLIPVYDRSGRANLRHALETCVMLELERRGAEITYVITEEEGEVDFLAQYPDNSKELIQVCADLNARAVRERETGALLKAAKEHPRATLHLIGLESGSAADMPKKIVTHAAVDWLLRNSDGGRR